MTKSEFTDGLLTLVRDYINNTSSFDYNPQVRVNPLDHSLSIVNGSDMLAEIEASDEAIEEAAGVDGDASEDAADFQVKQNPDFYAVKKLIYLKKDGTPVPDEKAVTAIVRSYFY